MKKKRIILVLILASSLLAAVVALTAAATPEATINVDSMADTLVAGDNECTLREAINNANTDSDTTGGDCTAGSGADVIELPAGTYTLTIAGGGENNNATGDLDILESLTINGAGALSTTISGNQLDRVLHILNLPTKVLINELTIANGGVYGNGGGILNQDAVLVFRRSILRDNSSYFGGPCWGGGGAGLWNLGTAAACRTWQAYE